MFRLSALDTVDKGPVRAHSLNNVPSQVRTLWLFRRFQALHEAIFGDFGRFCPILGDFSVSTLPKTAGLTVEQSLLRRLLRSPVLFRSKNPMSCDRMASKSRRLTRALSRAICTVKMLPRRP